VKLAVSLSVGLIATCLLAKDLASPEASVPMSTADRLITRGWWPTKGSVPRERYVGSAACAPCHAAIVETQKSSPMATASVPANSGTFAKSGITSPLRFSISAYTYELTPSASGTLYSASDGAKSVSADLGWVFGTGHFGQTFVCQQEGTFYESNLSYYPAIHGLDFTTGHRRQAPASLAKVLGEPQSPSAIQSCFGCHATASTAGDRFDPSQAILGVTCESCHGPGTEHVAAMSVAEGNPGASSTLNPASLSPQGSVDFCGACHRTRLDAIQTGVHGVLTVRFPAYRLQSSRCWGSNGDSRVTCMACHDPHQPLGTDAASYDKNCLSCHRLSSLSQSALSQPPSPEPTSHEPVRVETKKDHPGAACPVAQKYCVTCHMPKIDIPEMHTTFTDHKIAVHRAGASYQRMSGIIRRS
jgi:hypothetical protein